jgi:hypothetical protein
MLGFVRLPYDTGIKILSHLSMPEIVALSLTCECLCDLFLTKVEVETGRQAAKLYNLFKNDTCVALHKPQRFPEGISFCGHRRPSEERDKPAPGSLLMDWDGDEAE